MRLTPRPTDYSSKVLTPQMFGAVGNGIADDTAALLLMKAAAIASVEASALVEGRFTTHLDYGIGKYRVVGNAEIFPNTGSPRPWGLVVRGVSPDATQFLWEPSGTEPCFYRPFNNGGSCRSSFSNFSIIVTNSHPTAAGFISSADGSGGPQSELWENITFQNCPYGIIADGSNLNSERTYRKLTFSGNNTLAGVYFRGLPVGQAGGDQFVNQWFYDLSYTCSYGSVIVARYGGGLHILGGNFIHTNQVSGTACGSPVYVSGLCNSGAVPQLRVPSGSYDVKTGMTIAYGQCNQTVTVNADVTLQSGSSTAAPSAITASAQLSDQSIGWVGPSIQVAILGTAGDTTISLKVAAGGTTHTLKRGDIIKVNGSTEVTHQVLADATLDTVGVSVSISPAVNGTVAPVNQVVECLSSPYILLLNSNHASGTAHLTMSSVRAEHRARDSRFMDSEWGTGCITVTNSVDTVNAFNVGPFASSTFRFGNDGGPTIKWLGGAIHGGHLYCYAINGWQTRNAVEYDSVSFSHTPDPGLNIWRYSGAGIGRQTHSNYGGAPSIKLKECRGNAVTNQYVGTFTISNGALKRQYEMLATRTHLNGVYGSLGPSQSVTIILPLNAIVKRIAGWMPASSGVTGTSPTWTLTNGNAVQLAQAAPATGATGFTVDVTVPYEAGTDIATRTLTLTANASVVGQTARWFWYLEF